MNKGFIMIEVLIVFIMIGVLISSVHTYMQYNLYTRKQDISEKYWPQLGRECDFICVLRKDLP